ncbi:MAG: AAA family ATPase [Methylophilaceae bacterium]
MSEFECPDLPTFLEKAEADAMDGNFDAIPLKLAELLTAYRRAKNGEFKFAEHFAERFESGDLPCGPDVYLAYYWHGFAAQKGSVKSATRLAQHKVWNDGYQSVKGARELSAMAISNALNDKRPDENDFNSAAQAALILLESKPSEEDLLLVRTLINHKQMANHPDFEEINTKLHRMNCHVTSKDISVKVASTRISEDGEFKVGAYKILEGKLPLMGLPDPDDLKKVLDTEFPWCADITEEIYMQLVMLEHSNKPVFKLRPLLLAGPPGVGKTSYVKRLAGLSRTPYRILMAAGNADCMFLKGAARSYSTARPSAIANVIATEFFVNPMFLVDEIDKTSEDNRNGRLWDVLLQFLEPASSKSYLDECLCVPCDFSHVNWIATANEIGKLPKPLIERFTVMTVQAPGPQHFDTILSNVMNSYALDLGIDVRMFPSFDNQELALLKRLSGPREINRIARNIIERKTVFARKRQMRN